MIDVVRAARSRRRCVAPRSRASSRRCTTLLPRSARRAGSSRTSCEDGVAATPGPRGDQVGPARRSPRSRRRSRPTRRRRKAGGALGCLSRASSCTEFEDAADAAPFGVIDRPGEVAVRLPRDPGARSGTRSPTSQYRRRRCSRPAVAVISRRGCSDAARLGQPAATARGPSGPTARAAPASSSCRPTVPSPRTCREAKGCTPTTTTSTTVPAGG